MRAGQQRGTGKTQEEGLFFKEVEHKKREANGKGGVQEQKASQIKELERTQKFGEGQSSM